MYLDHWNIVKKNLLSKMLREFAYEGIIEPVIKNLSCDETQFFLNFKKSKISYQYRGKKLIFGDFQIDPDSILRMSESDQKNEANDPGISPMQFMIDCSLDIGVGGNGIKDFTCTYFIKELQNTLLSDLHLWELAQKNSSKELIKSSYEELEGHFYGHPWLVVSKGRFGLGYEDFLNYVPESLPEVSLIWIGIRKIKSQNFSIPHFSFNDLYLNELGENQIQQFRKMISDQGCDPDDYLFLPVHPWQWDKMIIHHYIEDLCLKNMIYLGKTNERYRPQQAIRTLSPIYNKEGLYLKLTMTIFNTAVYRGIPYERVAITPDLTHWLQTITQQDYYLSSNQNVLLLGEIAGLYFDHPYFHQISKPPYQFKEMLATIWREPLHKFLSKNEKAIGLGGLLYRDSNQNSLVKAYIEQSTLSPLAWLEKFHQVVLSPLLHYMYQYGVAFNAHGQNLILVTENGIPTRLGIKDFSDDVNICERDFPELQTFPLSCLKVTLRQPPEILKHFIFSSLFACFYRYLSPLFLADFEVKEEKFWSLAAKTINEYQQKFPHLKERFDLFDLMTPQMEKVCLNRVRIFTYGYSDDSGRPEVDVHGKINNPLNCVDNN